MEIRDGVGKTTEANSSVFSQVENALFAVMKGFQAVKLCWNKILYFLKGSAS